MSESDHNLAETLAKFAPPRLPAGLARSLEIDLEKLDEKLDEKLGFGGDGHEYWLTSPAIRAEAAAQITPSVAFLDFASATESSARRPVE
jgi:hypothetical protein